MKQQAACRKNGFTFLETLIVLAVFCVCLSAALIPVRMQIETTEQQLFWNQLEQDLFFAQTYAITRNQQVNVVFFDQNNNKYVVSKSTVPRTVLIERDIPAAFKSAAYGLRSISFLSSGTTNRFGTVHFISKENHMKVVFLIGRGRFYFAEE